MNKAAQELGRLGGRVKSEAKAAAARRNGKKGGRGRKSVLPARSRKVSRKVQD